MDNLEPIIAKHPFFEGLSGEHRKILTGCAKNVRFEAGEYLFRENEAANEFYMIRHGGVAVEFFVPGREPIIVQTLKEGDMLGWSSHVPPYKWRFDARAMEIVRAVAFDGVCFRGKCDENPELGYEMLKRFSTIMAQRLQATRLQILDVYGPKL